MFHQAYVSNMSVLRGENAACLLPTKYATANTYNAVN